MNKTKTLENGLIQVELTQGKSALVEERYWKGWLERYHWYTVKYGTDRYYPATQVIRDKKKHVLLMHKLIAGISDPTIKVGFVHAPSDDSIIDCRRDNIQIIRVMRGLIQNIYEEVIREYQLAHNSDSV